MTMNAAKREYRFGNLLLDIPDGPDAPPVTAQVVVDAIKRAGGNAHVSPAGHIVSFPEGMSPAKPTSHKARVAKAKNAHSSEAQSKRAKSGNKGEDLVGDLNAACKAANIAWLWKVPTAVTVLATRGHKVTGIFAKKAIVDFVGFTAGGRAIGVEVKKDAVELSKRDGQPLPCSLSLSRIEPQQRDYLTMLTATGGLALVLVVHGNLCVYAVPWSAVRAAELLSEDVGKPLATFRGPDLEKWRVGPRPYLERFVKGPL